MTYLGNRNAIHAGQQMGSTLHKLRVDGVCGLEGQRARLALRRLPEGRAVGEKRARRKRCQKLLRLAG